MAKRRPLILGLGLVLLVYLPSLRFALLLYDDNFNLLANPYLRPLSAAAHFWTRPFAHLYVPLTYSVWAACEAIFGTAPWVFHALNLATLLVATILVHGLVRRLCDSERAGLAAALCFALHPAQVESVAWASSFKGLLAGTLALAALHLHLRSARSESIRWSDRAFALLFFLLALFAKTTVVMLPAMAALLQRGVFRHSWRRIARELAPWGMLSVVFALVAMRVYPDLSDALPAQSIADRARIAGDALFWYLTRTFLPVRYAIDTGHGAAYVLSSKETWLTALCAALVVVGFLSLAIRRRNPIIGVGGGLYLLALLPILGLVPHEMEVSSTFCDRYLFLALLGPAYVFGALSAGLESLPLGRRLAAGGIAVLGILTVATLPQWRSDETLWTAALKANPRSARAHANLGMDSARRGDWRTAEDHYRQQVELEPTADGRFLLGVAQARNNRIPEAVRSFAAACRDDSRRRLYRQTLSDVWKALPPSDRQALEDVRAIAEQAERDLAALPPDDLFQ